MTIWNWLISSLEKENAYNTAIFRFVWPSKIESRGLSWVVVLVILFLFLKLLFLRRVTLRGAQIQCSQEIDSYITSNLKAFQTYSYILKKFVIMLLMNGRRWLGKYLWMILPPHSFVSWSTSTSLPRIQKRKPFTFISMSLNLFISIKWKLKNSQMPIVESQLVNRLVNIPTDI